MVINHVAKSQKITHLTIWSQVILKDHPKSKDFTQQFFCWGYWNSKETHQNWPIGLIIQHFKCHVLIFPPQISDKKPCKFNIYETKNPLTPIFSPIFIPSKTSKFHSKPTFCRNDHFFPKKHPTSWNEAGKRLYLRKSAPNIGAEHFIGSQYPSHGWKLWVFVSCRRDNHKFAYVTRCATKIYWKTD